MTSTKEECDLVVKDVTGCGSDYIKSIICDNNSILKALIEDSKFEGQLELSDECELNTFNEVYKLYGGDEMTICDENVVKMLKFSICYDDKNIKEYCVSYITENENERILFELLQIDDLINVENDLKLLNERMKENIITRGYLILENEELLLKMTIENLERILKNEKLVIMKNETNLLNKLLRWYKYNNDKCEEDKEREELKEEFSKLLLKSIKSDKIQNDLIDEEFKEEYNELKENLVLNSEIIHVNVNEKILNKKLIEVIFDNVNETKKDSIQENDLNQLNEEFLKSDLLNLLKSNEDIKIIEILLNIIVEMGIYYIIPNEMKNLILCNLLYEYNQSKRNRTLKCISIYINDKQNIDKMIDICGKEILYEILNNEYYLNIEEKDLITKYIREMRLTEAEEEEIRKIIINKELLKELIIEKITSFSYPHSEYRICGNVLIEPSFDGTYCEFSIYPSLPDGKIIHKDCGIIYGKVKKDIEKKEYEITCKNLKSEMKFKIFIELVTFKFTEVNKSSGISISDDGELLSKNSRTYNIDHCYLNLKMEKGIYHITYMFLSHDYFYNSFYTNQKLYDDVYLGLSTNNTYSEGNIHYQKTTCNYYARNRKSQYITSYCHIGTIVNKNPNFDHGNCTKYEIIVDMNKREFSICHNDSSPVLLVKDLPSPLYPYAALYGFHIIVLSSVSHEM